MAASTLDNRRKPWLLSMAHKAVCRNKTIGRTSCTWPAHPTLFSAILHTNRVTMHQQCVTHQAPCWDFSLCLWACCSCCLKCSLPTWQTPTHQLRLNSSRLELHIHWVRATGLRIRLPELESQFYHFLAWWQSNFTWTSVSLSEAWVWQ